MKNLSGQTVGMIGAMASLPRRLAARYLERAGGRLRRDIGKDTRVAVIGRQMLQRYDRKEIERRIDDARRPSVQFISENAFVRLLTGEHETGEPGTIDQAALIEQSRIVQSDFEMLMFFDAFISDHAPFALRDLILARKYAALIASGSDWHVIARAVHRDRSAGKLTALPLEAAGRNSIYARFENRLGELDGQFLLPVDQPGQDDEKAMFAAAEDAEKDGQLAAAAQAYARCLQVDPGDAVAAFNHANCLRALGVYAEAQQSYLRAIRIDPQFVDAWFNLACLDKERGDPGAAKRHFEKAVALDRDYRDAIYNLAALALEQDELDTARLHWERYLELDSESDWARSAQRGLEFIKRQHQKVG